MDKYNRFHTPAIYNLVRFDWLIIGAVPLILVILHWREVHWWRFTAAFAFPDVIATLPGLYFYYGLRSGSHRSIPSIIHKLYNFGHSFAGITLFCAVWYLFRGHVEWAMLAFPIHLAGDRSVFGNIYKPLGLAFEPVQHEAFRRFERDYQAAGVW
jgi:hypothetical protein